MSHSIALALFMIPSVIACGGREGQHDPSPPQHEDVTFTLVVGGELTTSRGHEPVVSATVLHAGDRMTLQVHATRQVELFVAYCDSSAKQRVYGPLTTPASGDVYIPEHGSFRVDENVGLEHLFVIASSKPLASSDPKLDQVLHDASGDEPCSQRLAMTTEASRELDDSGSAADVEQASSGSATSGSATSGSASDGIASTGSAALVAATEPAATPIAHPAAPPRAPHPHGVGAAAPQNFPRVPKRWRARGFDVEDDSGSTSSTLSDASGIAIWAMTLKHE